LYFESEGVYNTFSEAMANVTTKKAKVTKIDKAPEPQKINYKRILRMMFWFLLGTFLGFFFFVSFLYITYRTSNADRVYEGVFINGTDFGKKSPEQVKSYFAKKNNDLGKTSFILKSEDIVATISAKQIGFGFDEELIAKQAYSIGRSDDILSNMSMTLQAYIGGIQLPAAVHYQEEKLNELLKPLSKQLNVDPVEGLFTYENNRVTAFKLSKNGRRVDDKALKDTIIAEMKKIAISEKPQEIILKIPLVVREPKISTDKINNYGIKELIAEGTSKFAGSIPNRAFNINLSASRINGALVAPGEVFSFNKTVGDISSLTGYKQAYVISGGKTILGDGGGVCQVSTTLFRAALNAGLPIVERNQHAYRVGYYEQDSGPGVDAAIFSPGTDFKFKNDTGKHILIQAIPDMTNYTLAFQLYGTKDNREVIINDPVILSTSPAPEAEYIDDPNLPKGEIKQIDFSAAGANVFFTRVVKKDGKEMLNDKFVSNYRPWKAVYMRGTKE
jgi:vancomycin resistance protein YoaR